MRKAVEALRRCMYYVFFYVLKRQEKLLEGPEAQVSRS